jgi:hypothetical protein
MAIDPDTLGDFKALVECTEASFQRLQQFRMERASSLREFVGKHYSWQGAQKDVPVNHLEQGIAIYTRSLAAKNPDILITSPVPELKPTAKLFQTALGELLRRPAVDFERALRRLIIDALFTMGVAKIGMTTDDDSDFNTDDADDEIKTPPTPFFDVVDFDDWVHDSSARRWEDCRFMGHRFRMPLSKAREIESFSREARSKLTDSDKLNRPYEMASSLSYPEANSFSGKELEPSVDLWCIFLPRERLEVIFQCDPKPAAALLVKKWDGPEEGPYERLCFTEVPNNVMPLSPVQNWRALHDLSNSIFRKMDRQARAYKAVTLYQDGASKDAERLRDASDGDMIKTQDPNRINRTESGGVNANLLGFWSQVKQVTSLFQGNMEALGGLSPQSPTLGQDRLLNQNASARLSDMGQSVENCVQRIVKRLGEYLFYDPLIELPLTYENPHLGISIPVKWTPEERRGEFLDYNFTLVPYSMQPQSPQQRLQTIMQILPIYAQMGVQFNVPRLTELIAQYAQIQDLDSIVLPGSYVPQQMQGQPPQKMKMNVERSYRRISQPANPPPSPADQMTQGLMQQQPGANVQAVMGGMR